jgi:toxin ParE1/3/4
MTGGFRVRLSDRAEEDLIDIWLRIARDSPRNADRFLDVLNGRIDSLADYPGRGVPRPELGKGIRMLVEGNYLILYRVEAKAVLIARVVHGGRDLRELIVE